MAATKAKKIEQAEALHGELAGVKTAVLASFSKLKASQAEERAGRVGANKVSVMVELQADCFAGVWAALANQARKILEPGDLESGLQAASSVGDDTLQKREQGTVVPDSFTHGSSAQRVKWFRRGFDAGTTNNCDTFGAGAAL